MAQETIGFVGVGLMGQGMATNIVEKGFPLTVMAHRNRAPIDELVKRGATEAKSLREIAEKSSIVFLCVTGSKEVEAVIRGKDGLKAGLTPGSIGRHEFYRQLASGSISRAEDEDPKVKVALHYGPEGAVDGYVSYKFAGWDTRPFTMEVVDLVAATDHAYLELWQYLGAIDLVESVTWEEAMVDDPLPWALEDSRCVEASEPRDMLWLRILDVRQALEARHYPADGRLVFEVADPLGFARGTFALEVKAGQAAVEPLPDGAPADLALDVSALSSIYLGGVCPVTLKAAGTIVEASPGAAFRARQMFAVERATHCLTHF